MFYEVFLDNAIKGGLVIGSRFILNLEFPQSVWHKNNPTETVKSTKWREPQKWHFTRFYRWKFMNSISKRLKVKNRKDEKTVYHKNWQISIEDAYKNRNIVHIYLVLPVKGEEFLFHPCVEQKLQHTRSGYCWPSCPTQPDTEPEYTKLFYNTFQFQSPQTL